MIGRYQVMALLQYARFRTLGYSDKDAKLFALFFADFYAILKNKGFHRIKNNNEKFENSKSIKNSKFENVIDLFGIKVNYELINDEKVLKVSNRRILAENFRKIIMRFQSDEQFNKALQEAFNIVRNYPLEILQNNNKFFNYIYKPRRDELAEKWRSNYA